MIEHIFLGEVELLYLMKWLVSVCYADTPLENKQFNYLSPSTPIERDPVPHLITCLDPPLSVPLNIEPQFNYNTIILCLFSTDLELQHIQEHDTATQGKANTWFQYPASKQHTQKT